MNLKKGLDEKVHDLFIEQLYAGKYQIGQRIDPAELTKQFSISRTPVVQALKQLANERVLVVDRGGKFFITIPDEKMLKDVCDVRCLLEQYAVSLLIKQNNRDILLELRDMAVKNKSMWESREEIASIHYCREFHKKFVESTNNRCLLETYLPILYQYGGIKYALGNQWMSHNELGDWHLKIMEHIINNDEEQAKRATKEHIDMCCLDILTSIQMVEAEKFYGK